jgi:hypothetical protein
MYQQGGFADPFQKPMTGPNDGKTIRHPASAQLMIDSGDRFVIDTTIPVQYKASANPTKQYNDFVINKGMNLLQGSFTRLAVTEVRFPWAIPNVNTRNQNFYVSYDNTTFQKVTIPTGGSIGGFYSGPELANAIAVAVNAQTAKPGGWGNLVVEWVEQNQCMAFYADNSTLTSGVPNIYFSPFSGPIQDGVTPTTNLNVGNLLPMIGLDPMQIDPYKQDISGANNAYFTGACSLTYTNYVDIVSDALTGYQRVKDISTQNNIPRQAIVCRLYVNDESGTNIVNDISNNPVGFLPGTRAFILYRKFPFPKIINWETTRSIGQIDIRLYDDKGEPLYVPEIEPGVFYPMPDFNITLLASEN